MKTTPFRIELSTEAETDFDKSYNYYLGKSPKIADAFFLRVNHSLELISKSPKTFPFVYKDIRKYVIKRFPFIIYYKIQNSSLQVIAIFHTSKNPVTWNHRVLK